MRIPIRYVVSTYPGLSEFCEVERHRHYGVWVCYGLSFGFNFYVIFIGFLEDSIYGGPSISEFGVLSNCLFLLVDIALCLALRHSHFKLICQPWQRRYPAIHLLIAVPFFFITNGFTVMAISIRELWQYPKFAVASDTGSEFLLPLMAAYGCVLTVFLGTLQLLALAILMFHPEFSILERYEPIHERVEPPTSESESSDAHHTNRSKGLLASRFLIQKIQIRDTQHSNMNTSSIYEHEASLPTSLHFIALNTRQNGEEEAEKVCDNYQPRMDFDNSLKSWRSLSWIKPIYAPLIKLLVATITLWNMAIGYVYLRAVFEMSSDSEWFVFTMWVIPESSTQHHVTFGAQSSHC